MQIYGDTSAESFHDSGKPEPARSRVGKIPNDVLSGAALLQFLEECCHKYFDQNYELNVCKTTEDCFSNQKHHVPNVGIHNNF